ncbi:hypothetical protein BKA81DRAFT_166085 [Phyllosticta paracitricarpa]
MMGGGRVHARSGARRAATGWSARTSERASERAGGGRRSAARGDGVSSGAAQRSAAQRSDEHLRWGLRRRRRRRRRLERRCSWASVMQCRSGCRLLVVVVVVERGEELGWPGGCTVPAASRYWLSLTRRRRNPRTRPFARMEVRCGGWLVEDARKHGQRSRRVAQFRCQVEWSGREEERKRKSKSQVRNRPSVKR